MVNTGEGGTTVEQQGERHKQKLRGTIIPEEGRGRSSGELSISEGEGSNEEKAARGN
jgi:hypothetical protein